MAEVEKLRREHAQLVEIVGRLSVAIAEPRPRAATELFRLRKELTSTLIAHLKAEDWLLYPRLLTSRDPRTARTARAFNEEMGGLAEAYAAYSYKWTATSIEADWNGYCEETRGIIDALTKRIDRENNELYPLFETIQQAA